jgi:hypothetical protein
MLNSLFFATSKDFFLNHLHLGSIIDWQHSHGAKVTAGLQPFDTYHRTLACELILDFLLFPFSSISPMFPSPGKGSLYTKDRGFFMKAAFNFFSF